jgi:hypothetical protein
MKYHWAQTSMQYSRCYVDRAMGPYGPGPKGPINFYWLA